MVQLQIERAKIDLFQKEILEWWKKNGASYSWRSFRDPFSVLTAEILLRKTNAEKVERLIENVMKKIPSCRAVKKTPTADLERILLPFGMQKRKARELKRLAAVLEKKFQGRVPSEFAELNSLPGVGNYIASAVLCFGYRKKRPIVDTNVVRVYHRVFSLNSKRARPRDDPLVWDFAQAVLPRFNYKKYNYAVLDFAKKVCRARSPLCRECPIYSLCRWERK